MKTYRFTLKTQSAFGTPLVGDTLFGQMCWAIAHQQGAEKLTALLQGYTEQRPFMVVSDALPSGYLPLPTLPSVYWKNDGDEDRKKLKKKQWIKQTDTAQPLEKWQQSAVAESEIFSKTRSERYYNSISRDSLIATPFSQSQIWYEPETQLDLIIVLDESRFSAEECQECLRQIGLLGFGRDATVGMGRFDVVACEAFDYAEPANPTSYLTLANTAPQKNFLNSDRSFYQITTRFGRHGDVAALSASPFKKPIILCKAGAVLTPNEWQSKPFLGNGLGNVSYSQPNAVHQGYAPVVPIALPDSGVQNG